MIARARWLVHPLALLPLALLFYDFLIDNPTANPIQEITQRTGKTALILLILTLVVTPVNRHFRLPDLVPLRKRLGLYAFLYATLHLSIFVGLDYFFDWELILLELSEKLAALGIPGLDAEAFDMSFFQFVDFAELIESAPLLLSAFGVDLSAVMAMLPPDIIRQIEESGLLDDLKGEEGSENGGEGEN